MMLKAILFAVVIVLACMGLCEFMHLLKMLFLRPHTEVNTFLVVKLTGEETVKQLEYVGKQTAWLGKSFAKCTIAVYDSLSVEQTEQCAVAARKYDMIYCPLELVEHIIDTLS